MVNCVLSICLMCVSFSFFFIQCLLTPCIVRTLCVLLNGSHEISRKKKVQPKAVSQTVATSVFHYCFFFSFDPSPLPLTNQRVIHCFESSEVANLKKKRKVMKKTKAVGEGRCLSSAFQPQSLLSRFSFPHARCSLVGVPAARILCFYARKEKKSTFTFDALV